MKLWEIDWTDGKQYKGHYQYGTGQIWTVKGGSLVNSLGNITEIYNLEIISQLDFEPWVDWSKVEVDTKILVSNDSHGWFSSHFAKYENGEVYVYPSGRTSWTQGNCNPTSWKYAKLAESEANNDGK